VADEPVALITGGAGLIGSTITFVQRVVRVAEEAT
jgi:hypothetical protein